MRQSFNYLQGRYRIMVKMKRNDFIVFRLIPCGILLPLLSFHINIALYLYRCFKTDLCHCVCVNPDINFPCGTPLPARGSFLSYLLFTNNKYIQMILGHTS